MLAQAAEQANHVALRQSWQAVVPGAEVDADAGSVVAQVEGPGVEDARRCGHPSLRGDAGAV